ncbi:SRPBCC domain-containing protein [Thermocoleostomius sinensis]|uniref:SRPBCC domain-containing protein n=1 Tax=Thermocoleostomius sinensis A174 TaxID=2016057 RepID=A0A9E8ZB48_9CYAN|nr:SRPBCC domain-containing protein [Thermocoleostomius sinensis]WAL59893.1 SRPBCC domain-containing protein [Thermocoleostomius sinensis A174]
MSKPTFLYVTYIATTIEQLWDAITSDSFTQQYLGEEQLQSDWQAGSPIEQVNSEGELEPKGEVLRSRPPHELCYTFQFFDHTQPSCVRFLLEPSGTQVKLTVVHDRLEVQSYLNVSRRGTMCLSTLKYLLELELAIAA